MKRWFAAFFVFSFCLLAADFWTKPSTEWTDKDLQKMMTSSPWAHSDTVGGGGAGPGDSGAPGPLSERGGRGGGGGGAPGGGPPPGAGGGSATIVARWQTALPVKEAFVRLKFGAEAATSPDAKKMLERVETTYAIVLSGPFGTLLREGNVESLKKAIMDASSLSAKGKDEVKPTDVEIGQKDMLFTFPRSAAFTVDDKEVEFSTKLGEIAVKYKFKLKDMVYNGKLEM